MTPSRDILLSKGEERAAEDQQNVISALENVKLRSLASSCKTNYITCMFEMR